MSGRGCRDVPESDEGAIVGFLCLFKLVFMEEWSSFNNTWVGMEEEDEEEKEEEKGGRR